MSINEAKTTAKRVHVGVCRYNTGFKPSKLTSIRVQSHRNPEVAW